jgi:MFS family permease
MAPFAVVAPFLGPVVDRFPAARKFLMTAAAASRAVLCLLMATTLDSVALYPLAFGSLVFSKTHAVVKSAAVPEIIEEKQQLVKANGVLAVGAVVSSFLVGGVGYAVATAVGEAWVLRAGAVLFVVAAALATEVGSGAVRRESAPSQAVEGSTLRGAGVLHAAAVMATLRTCVGFLTFLIAFDLRRSGASTAWFGLAVSAAMIGTSLGNIIGPRVRRRVREESMLVGAAAVVAVVAAVMTQNPNRYGSAALAGVLGLVTAAGKLAFDSLVQRDVMESIRAKTFARFEAAFQLVWVVGALIPVVLTIRTAFGFALLATATAVAAIWYVLQRPVWRSSVVRR